MRIPAFLEEIDLQECPPGQTIFEERQPGDVMYVIREGLVELKVRGQVIDTLGPGDVFGEMALIDSHERSASAVAKTDCKLLPVDEKQFLFMVQQVPFFSIEVMRVMCERLRRVNVHLQHDGLEVSPASQRTSTAA